MKPNIIGAILYILLVIAIAFGPAIWFQDWKANWGIWVASGGECFVLRDCFDKMIHR